MHFNFLLCVSCEYVYVVMHIHGRCMYMCVHMHVEVRGGHQGAVLSHVSALFCFSV